MPPDVIRRRLVCMDESVDRAEENVESALSTGDSAPASASMTSASSARCCRVGVYCNCVMFRLIGRVGPKLCEFSAVQPQEHS